MGDRQLHVQLLLQQSIQLLPLKSVPQKLLANAEAALPCLICKENESAIFECESRRL